MKEYIKIFATVCVAFAFGYWSAYVDYKEDTHYLQQKLNQCQAIMNLNEPEFLQFCEERIEC